MNDLNDCLSGGFKHYFLDFLQRVDAMSDRLSEQEFWEKPFPYGNSFGNLVLHLCGNMNYYIGAQVEGANYQRNREAEFTEKWIGQKGKAIEELRQAVTMVVNSLEKQGKEDWSKAYHAVGVDDVPDRFSIYLRCAVHFHHHIGQMTYMMKEWDRQRTDLLSKPRN